MYYIGIDNGATGSIGIIDDLGMAQFHHTPSFTTRSYTKTSQNITRINYNELHFLLKPYSNAIVLLERPMINFTRFKQSMSASRALEATLICLESLNLEYKYIDSRLWQHKYLEQQSLYNSDDKKYTASKRSYMLKKESKRVAQLLYPHVKFTGFNDGDGLLIARYAKDEYTQDRI